MKGLWETAIGTVLVTVGDLGITNVAMASDADKKHSKALPKELTKSLDAHMDNKSAPIRVDLHTLAPFRQMATAKLLEIPYGEVRSYSWLAREVGRPNAVRAAASACANNPIPLIIPCHRVVRTDGSLSKYSLGGVANKKSLLKSEGVDLGRLANLASRHIRFIGDAETKEFHVVGCKQALGVASPIEMRMPEEALDHMLAPCRLCRPVHMF